MPKPKTNSDQYDSPWKEALEEYFEASMAFFFPTIHAEIDWAKPHRFLDKELAKVVRQATVTEQYVDKLVQVYRLTGEKSWVIVHIDVQNQYETDFSKRMFQYHYRLFDRYDLPVATLVIYGDDNFKWQPQKYEHGLWGSKATFEFSSVKLLNYVPDQLEQSTNPFAVVVLAHLYTKATKNNPHDRYDLKLKLTRLLYERGYNKEQILSLYRYIDWLMALPQELEEQLDQQIAADEEARTMTYVTSMERFGYKRGMEAGLQEGHQVGLQEGHQVGLQEGRQVGLQEGRQVGLQEGHQVGLQEGHQVGLQEGRQVGLQEGRQVGLQEGHQVGLQEGRQVGLQEGRREGELQALRISVVETLQVRFGELHPTLIQSIEQINEVTLLRQLHRQAILTTSLADFEAKLKVIPHDK